MKLLFLLVLASINFIGAVDKEIFKTCAQSSFCRRCRSVKGPSRYEVLQETLTVEDDRIVTVDIRNNENQQLFVLRLGLVLKRHTHDNEIFHIQIDEKSSIRKRYRVDHDSVLNDPLVFKYISVIQNTSVAITVQNAELVLFPKAVIKLSPFQIDIINERKTIVTVNGKDLMRFEHLRNKPQSLDPSEDPDSWEESFRGVVDSKPNGPEAVALDFTFPESEVLFGIPEHADSFALKPTIDGEPYRLFNLDVYRYELDSPMALYGSVPVIYSHGETPAGVFWLNSADTFVDIHNKKTVHFMSEAGIMEVFILIAPTVNELFRHYASLTGVAKLPPLWSLGYHQSRWDYFTQEEVLEVVDKFDSHDLQLDTFWLDIEYTDGKRYFTWNYTAFPNPREMISKLSESGRHLTTIIDPHTKKDENYFFYSNGSARDFFVKDKNGVDFEGNCWPGLSSYIDFFNPTARKYYADQFLLTNFVDSSTETGIWNDMNEPSVFDVPEITMPRDNIHLDGWEHRTLHNLYGHMQVMGTFDGAVRRSDGHLRPFILTRAFFSGSQRYAAIWTGDNHADWKYLPMSIKMCLTLSVAGFSFCGSDVGGFFDDPEDELYVRWFQAGAFQPFFRSHSELTSKRMEPYLLPEAEMSIVREAIRKRYALLQFWYTMFYEHESSFLPVMRPMLMEFPADRNVFEMDNQYMLSDKLMVRPVVEKGVDTVSVYFPSGTWFDFDDYRQINSTGGFQSIAVDDNKIPVYQRSGTIVPVKETVRKSSEVMSDDPISFFIAYDFENERAWGYLFYDDGKSYGYQTGEFAYVMINLVGSRLWIAFLNGQQNPALIDNVKVGRILIAGYGKVPEVVTLERPGGLRTDLEVVSHGNFFEIKTNDLTISDQWTILFNGARRNILCASLALLAIFINFYL